MRRAGLWAALGAAAVSFAVIHCASTDAIDYFACAADGACPAPLVCSPDRICAPAEVCGDIVYSGGQLVLDGGAAPQDTDLDGRLGCADPQCAGKACVSGAACLTGETCLADGGCGGGTFCNAPPECHRAEGATCPSGACVYPQLDAGSPCNDGYCDSSGVCQRFGYTPSNFQVADVIGHAQANVNVLCDSTFDTTSGQAGGCLGSASISPVVLSDGDAGSLVVVAFKGLTLVPDASITISGDKPLVFAVFGDARIDGRILAGAHLGTPGPGGRDCGMPSALSGGGGGGGGFTTGGGDGGAPGTRGGAVTGPTADEPLVGGCSGGGTVGVGGPRAGGGAGGAVQISASGVMQIHGVIAVPGGGGLQGVQDAGGSGGGSGGEILLEGDSVVLDSAAALTANGGSGGSGLPTDPTRTASDGEDGHVADLNPAVTASPGTTAGAGGNGAVRGAPAAAGSAPNCLITACGTSGGGGGGLGRIQVRATSGCTRGAGTVLSPDVPSCSGP